MSIKNELKYASLDELFLDPFNPRLGRHLSDQYLDQGQILEEMLSWSLDELALSFVESGGYWVQEALIVVKEPLYSKNVLVVVEGNRRLAALKVLAKAKRENEFLIPKLKSIISLKSIPDSLFQKIPYLEANKREDVNSFLGFRHVTGIKEWNPSEKAEFISKMVDSGLSYEDVRKKIGSKTPTVRNLYISYKLLLQIEDTAETIPEKNIDQRFSVLYLTLQKDGVQKYLNIDILADPKTAKRPVPIKYIKNLKNFAVWLFGDDKKEPLFSDSRSATTFSNILKNTNAIKYLETNENPNFDQAVRIANADEDEITSLIYNAIYNIETAMPRIHLHKNSKTLNQAIDLLLKHLEHLKITFDKK